jgi:DNA-binding CsgD family transcriptional regulator
MQQLDPLGGLTRRELEIINQLLKDMTNQEIAEALSLSYNTVVTHRKNIFKKLNIRSGIGLVLWAIDKGLKIEK